MSTYRPAPKGYMGLPVISRWKALDKATGIVYMHTVRRCPNTGMTIHGRRPIRSTKHRST